MNVSNPDRIMFPETGTTKGELVAHYERVAERMLPWVAGRPLTLERYPKGIGGKGFFQKNAAKHFPESILRVDVPKNDGTISHPVVEQAADLPYLANQGTVTFHVWTARLPDLGEPTHLVLDLDPSDEDLGKTRAVTEAGREVMEDFGLAPELVASGSRGFHLWAALEPGHDYETVARVSWCLAALVAARNPDVATAEFLKKERGSRVYVDWLRNRWGQSIACPYSLRARSTPSVATPLRWEELDSAIPAGWDIHTVNDRLSDPPAMPTPTRLDTENVMATATELGIEPARIHDRFRG